MSSLASNPQPWWRSFNRTHWFVFAAASLAWLFDCLDQQVFNLSRDGAVSLVRLVGVLVLPFLPETNDKPLPD